MTILTILVLIGLLAFICEWVDSSLGMGYGTILSPTLILAGFPALDVVPAVLISQAIGGLVAGYHHHRFENVSFTLDNWRPSKDLQAVLWISTLGVLASIVSAVIGVKLLSKEALTTYIGALVLIMGIFILIGFTFEYSPKKMMLVGLVSAFNKGLSGGGFGPLVTGGQMVLGSSHQRAVGVTTGAEVPICVVGFITYLLLGQVRWDLTLALCIGAAGACYLGPLTTKYLSRAREVIAILLCVLGGFTLLKTFGILNLPISV